MTQTGLDRQYITPAIDPGGTYSCEVRASWSDAAGKQITRTQRISVYAGNTRSVDFTLP